MTEHLPTAPQAIAEYMNIAHWKAMGDIPVQDLHIWHESVRAASLSPEQKLHAGSIAMDLAWSNWKSIRGSGSEISPDDASMINAYIRESDLYFGAVSKSNDASRRLKAQANILRAGLKIHSMWATEETEAFELGYDATGKSYVRSAEWVLQNYVKEDDPEYIPLINSLTGILLFHYNPWHKILTGPAPSRAASLPESQSSWSLIFHSWAQEEDIMGSLRIGPIGPADTATLPPSELGHDDYPSKHGYGTLQAAIDLQQYRTKRGIKTWYEFEEEDRPQPTTDAEWHLDTIARRAADMVYAQANTTPKPQPLSAENGRIVDAYRLLSPDTYMGRLDVHQIEPELNDLEIAFRSKQLPPDERVAYGWMQIELGTSSYDQWGTGTGLTEQYYAASELFYSAAQTFGNKAPDKAYAARLDAVSAHVYQQIADPEATEETTAQVLESYIQDLAVLGDEMIAYLAAMPSLDPGQRQAIEETMHAITTCLVVNTQTEGDFIATPASLRQRSPSHTGKRWDVTLWPLTRDGFTPKCYAKIQLSETEKKNLRVYGVHTIPRSEINPDGQHVVLANLLAKMRGEEVGSDTDEYNSYLATRLIQAADLLV
jgi:hypothetical protein